MIYYEAFHTTCFLIHKVLQTEVLFSLFLTTFYKQMRKLRCERINREPVNSEVWIEARNYDSQIMLLSLNFLAKSIWKTPDQLLFDPKYKMFFPQL